MPRMTTEQVIRYMQRRAAALGLSVGDVVRRGGQSERESELHNQIIDDLRRRGLYYLHSRMDAPTTINKGAPDFVIACQNGVTLWLEIKTSNGKLRPDQHGTLAWLKLLGHKVHVARSFDEYTAIMDGLRQKPQCDTELLPSPDCAEQNSGLCFLSAENAADATADPERAQDFHKNNEKK